VSALRDSVYSNDAPDLVEEITAGRAIASSASPSFLVAADGSIPAEIGVNRFSKSWTTHQLSRSHSLLRGIHRTGAFCAGLPHG